MLYMFETDLIHTQPVPFGSHDTEEGSVSLSEKRIAVNKEGGVSAQIRIRRDSLSPHVGNSSWEKMKPLGVQTANSTHDHSDKMPENGPALHVVIIVGCVMVGVVSVSLWLLVKYLMQRSQRWHEISTERNMERAIHLYNSQPLLQEPDYMYTALPVHQITVRTGGNSSPPHHYRNGHAPHHNKKEVHARSRPKRSGDISFVHADGRIDTFRMQGSPEMHSCESESNLSVADRSRRTASPHDEMAVDDVNDGLPNAVDMIGDCPPSYEEALHMPTLQGLHLPHYVNMNSREDGSHET